MNKFERFVIDGAFIERSNGNVPYAEIIYRLHYLENIMEKYKCFTPQDLDKRIAELEEENKELKESNRIKTYYVSECNRLYDEQQKEMAKLQEQLKNAPKFELGQDVFIVIDNIEKAKIEKTIQTISKAEEECSIWYSLTDQYGYALRLPEEQIFATEAEAQKYLEEHK